MTDDLLLLPRLGRSLQLRVATERFADINIRDFLISGLLRVRNKARGLVALCPNRAQREFSRTCTHRNIVLKARQMGITTYVAARFFVQTITHPGTMTVQVAHDQESAEEIFKIVHRFWENLPEGMKRGALLRSRANVRQMVFPRLDSEYRVATAADVNAGRGLTIHNLHCSETGIATLRPFTPEEEELVQRVGLTDAQIAWRRTTRAQLRGLAAQEYAEDPVSCFRASGECVFELDSIDRALESQSPPTVVRDNERLMIWFEPRRERQYIIGVDPAGGGSEGDYACAEVIDRQTAMQCAELHGHYSPRELAVKLVELGRMYNEALLVVERNNHGYGVLANLRAAEYQKVFRDGGQDGWLTSAVTRPAMIETLAAVLAIKPELFQSTRLLSEFRTFVRQRDGRSGGASGSHDDCVMAMAIALAGRTAVAGLK